MTVPFSMAETTSSFFESMMIVVYVVERCVLLIDMGVVILHRGWLP